MWTLERPTEREQKDRGSREHSVKTRTLSVPARRECECKESDIVVISWPDRHRHSCQFQNFNTTCDSAQTCSEHALSGRKVEVERGTHTTMKPVLVHPVGVPIAYPGVGGID
jgi:hypothetical protein